MTATLQPAWLVDDPAHAADLSCGWCLKWLDGIRIGGWTWAGEILCQHCADGTQIG